MKTFCLSNLFLAGMMSVALASCGGGTDANQQMAPAPTTQVQPTAPTDSQAVGTNPQPAPVIQTQALPEAINTFVQQYFPGTTVSYVETDSEYGGLEYDVMLSDGTKIDFDTNHQWDNIENFAKGIPASLVPQAIANHVKNSYQSMLITKIDREPYGYEIKLSNGLELKFDSSGRFMGLDD